MQGDLRVRPARQLVTRCTNSENPGICQEFRDIFLTNGMEEVKGSIPFSSTPKPLLRRGFLLSRRSKGPMATADDGKGFAITSS